MGKFFRNPWLYWRRALDIARELGLRNGPKRKVFDVGCGIPFFGRVCLDYDHSVIGLDVPETAREEAARILSIPYYSLALSPGCELPDGIRGFDLITLMGVNFKHAPTEWWSEEEHWNILLMLWGRLRTSGALVIRPNKTQATAFLLDRTWWAERFSARDESIRVDPFCVRVIKMAGK